MMESWIGGQKRSLASLLLMEALHAKLHQTHRTFPMMMTMMTITMAKTMMMEVYHVSFSFW